MGHLMTVQNVLRLLRQPLFLDRASFPERSKFFGFPFQLEPLSLGSLSCYVATESPDDINALPESLRKQLGNVCEDYATACSEMEVTAKARACGRPTQRVGALYQAIIRLIKDDTDPAWRTAGQEGIQDTDFDSDSYSKQASWDEWGKEYDIDVVSPGEVPIPSKLLARVFVKQMSSRTQAIAALNEIADQGEAAVPSDKSEEPSHFIRLVEIYEWFRKDWIPVRPVPRNPTTTRTTNEEMTYIGNASSRVWAKLFNLRYRMLLTYLAHTYQALGKSDPRRPGARPALLHRMFGEMYNLRTIASILVRMPLNGPSDDERAGPPFAMPESLDCFVESNSDGEETSGSCTGNSWTKPATW